MTLGQTYVCAICKDVFASPDSHEETLIRSEKLWGKIPESEQAVICDDCFPDFYGWTVEQGLAEGAA